MKKILLILLPFILTQTYCYAQPSIEWQKSLGGTDFDYAFFVQQTTDGGFIVAGETDSNNGDVTGHHGSNGGRDFWVVKLSSTRVIEWQNALGGTKADWASSVQQTADGGYIISGGSMSNDSDATTNYGDWDCWIVKLSSTGTIEWQKNYGGSREDYVNSIQQTVDGGYIFAGGTQSNDSDVTGNHGNTDFWVVKLYAGGGIQWQKALGGTGNDYAYSVRQTFDGGYIVAGGTESNNGDVTGHHGTAGYSDYWIVKLSTDGVIEWQKSLGGTNDDDVNSIRQTTDSGYIIAGNSRSNDGDVTNNHGDLDFWIVKLSSDSTIEWQKSLGGTDNDYTPSIKQTTDGGYIVAGSSFSNDGDVTGNHDNTGNYADFWIVKLGSNGAKEWQKCVGGTSYDYAESIEQTDDGGYVVAGESFSDDGDITGHHGIYCDSWIVKLSPDPLGNKESNPANSDFQLYPNPATNQLTIHASYNKVEHPSLCTTNLLGQEALPRINLTPGPSPGGEGSALIDVSKLPSGIYFLQIQMETGSVTKKFVKE